MSKDSSAKKMDSKTSVSTTTPVPLLDLGPEYDAVGEQIEREIGRVIQSRQFVLGPDCQQLEDEMASFCQAQFGIGCASGSDALLLSLMAMGLAPGDEVLVPSFTFFATASAVWRLGGKPVFVDIDPVTYNIDPAKIGEAITERTKAIIPVHLFGQCADMDRINAIASDRGLHVTEDAAQAIGATYQGRPAGSLGDIGCFSFYPTKNLGGVGDGGMLTTSDEKLADRLRLLRDHGMQPRYHHAMVGINSRLDSMQAAALRIKLLYLASWSEQRRSNAANYAELFEKSGLSDHLRVPATDDAAGHVWNQFTVQVSHGQRDALRLYLTAARIGTEIYYPIPLHRQACFSSLGYGEGSLPITEQAAREVLSLPIYPGLTSQQQVIVVNALAQFFGCQRVSDDLESSRARILTMPSRPDDDLPRAKSA